MTEQPPMQVDKNDIKVALLENNQVILDRMDKAIEANSDKIMKAFNEKTNGLMEQVTGLATKTGSLTERVSGLESWRSSMWAKLAGIQAILAIIFSFIGFFLGGGHLGGH